MDIDNNNNENEKKLEIKNDKDNTKKRINYHKCKKRVYNEIKKDSSVTYFKGKKKFKAY